ncbi:glycosyltransferase family 2 protein [uncultured Vibrio sp.]|uniref:glycosyltransferase family 2 protein n=1 Tax=uncultured Vibrio sp. TaxID=114054 RepID=UPI000913D026|nr:glycosyltransferase family 2 protein [uncultured Vibrio sp.]OIQ25087.1 MAG: glycosyltransferase [Vibrio sp. MedPE-SWchi]
MNNKKLVSISIPVLNEEENLLSLYERLVIVSDMMHEKCNMEFLFSDNNSSDRTWDILKELSSKDDRVRAIRFTKNVGFQNSILTNYLYTSGDAVMQIDADLQDPPEMLVEFFKQWENGYKVVYGIRRKRPENRALYLFRKFGYWVIDKISEHPIPRDVGDFRLIDRQVIDILKRINTPQPYLRGIIASLGFKQKGIVYDRQARLSGDSKFDMTRLVKLGLIAVFNHSTVPLRAASFLGCMILGLSMLGSLYYVGLKVFFPETPQGLASVHILVLFGIGLNSFLLGVIGEYLLRIYLVIRKEPTAIIEESININFKDVNL